LRPLPGDALRRAGLARLFGGVLRGGRRLTGGTNGGARRKKEASKAASRAERASNVPRREKDHALGLNESVKKRNRVLDNNIDEQRATVFRHGWTHSITQREDSSVHQ